MAAGHSPVLTTSGEVAWAFISTRVARFGTPADLPSDSGMQFTSELWTAVASSLGVQRHQMVVYTPKANGLCESFYCP